MPNSRQPYRADLEALRGFAILLVVAYHAGVPALGGGFVGVDVFFVLSGYFMARSLVQEYGTTGTLDLRAFYRKRALRLLPALIVVVTATLIAVWTLWAPIDRPAVAGTAQAVVLGVPNVALAREGVDYFAGARSPFLHTWSLGVEMQVALFGPLFFLAFAAAGGGRATGDSSRDRDRRLSALVSGVGAGLVVVGALSLGIAIRLTATDPSSAYFATTARSWEFVAGALLVLMLPAGSSDVVPAGAPTARGGGWWLQAAGLGAIVVAALLYDRATPYPGTAALLPVIGGAAVIAGGVHGRGLLDAGHWLVRAAGWFGTLSYSWYLWHWPVVLTAAVVAPASGVWARLAWSAAALGPAWLTHRWVERPLRERRGETATHGRWLPVATVGGCLTLALAGAIMHRSAERRVEGADQRDYAAARIDRMPHSCWASGSGAPQSASPCLFGDPGGSVTVALFGDSHAEHWLAALDRLGRERGWRVALFVKGGCPVSDARELIASRTDRNGRECARWREAAIQRLVALKPAVAVLSSFDEYVTRVPEPTAGRTPDGRVSPAAWERGLRRTYTRVAGAGIPVIAIRGTPRPGFDVPACLSRGAAGLPMASACEYERGTAVHYAARAAQLSAVRDAAARGLPIAAVDMTDAVCATSRCAVVRDGVIQFTDDNHLTASFTRSAAGTLGARVDAALATMGVRLP